MVYQYEKRSKMGDKAILARSLAAYKAAGSLVKFRRLADIWDILSQDNWYLEEIFPQDKLIAVELILPPRPRKPSTLPDKQTKPLMHPLLYIKKSDDNPRKNWLRII